MSMNFEGITISLQTAERDVNARLRRLIGEIREALRAPDAAYDEVRWLIDRLECHHLPY